jgi:uncharacterized protein (DUF58 family)
MAPRKANIRDRLGRLHWPVLGSLGVHPAGDYRSRGRGPGVEQADVREYVAGDDPRQIDWNLSARSDRTYVREAHPDRGLDAWLILDTSRSLDWGTARCLKREAAGELVVAASILLARRGNRVGALIFDQGLQHIVPPSSGRAARSTLIAEASRDRGTGEDGPTDLARALTEAGRLIQRPSLVIVVSDFLAPTGWQQPLKILGVRHEVLAAVIGDPREAELPDVGLLVLEDPETKRQIEVDTGSRRLRERFRTAAQEQRRELLKDLSAARAAVLELSTAEDVLDQLLRLFQRVETGRRGHAGVVKK